MNTMGEVNNEVMQGWENLKNGNIMGAIANTVGSITKLIKGINEYKDIDNTKEIEKQAKIIEGLKEDYEELEKVIEDAYTIKGLEDSNKDAQKNLQAQIDAIEAQKAAEEDKKKTDNAAIEEYDKQIKELQEQQKELQKQFVETMGGSYDYTGAAEQFLDAWLTAFEETGDGMKGLEDSFDDFWKSVLKKQVVYGGASEIMKNYMDKINEVLSNGELTDKEISDIEAKEEETKNKLNNFYKWANEKYGLADFDSEADTLSGLQAGIQGITEEQADILEAYWNAVRFSAASIDAKMDISIEAIKKILLNTESESENPIVANLKSIAVTTSYMHDLLLSITDVGRTGSVRVTLV